MSVSGETAQYFVSLVVSTTVVGIPWEVGEKPAVRAYLNAETSRLRWRYDPNAAQVTSTQGNVMNNDESIKLEGATNIKQFRCVRHSGDSTDAVLHVTLETL